MSEYELSVAQAAAMHVLQLKADLDKAEAEIERLRAELADSEGDAMNLQSIIDELRAESAELKEKVSGWAKRCGTADAKLSKTQDELDWFKRREEWIRRAIDAEGWPEMDAKRCSVWDFERKNPKPGDGT